jgi:hypothetical protein
MIGRRARRYREQSEIMPGWKEIRSIADVAQPRQPLYAVGRDERLDGPCSILFRLARLALAHGPRAIRFPGRAQIGPAAKLCWSDRQQSGGVVYPNSCHDCAPQRNDASCRAEMMQRLALLVHGASDGFVLAIGGAC